jgi:hypothetical protein
MDKLGTGVSEAKVPPMSYKYSEMRRKQYCHRTAGIGRPKEEEREAPSQMEHYAYAFFVSACDRKDYDHHR